MDAGSVIVGLWSLGEGLADLNIILKVFVLMTIVSFVRNHLGDGALSWIVILGFAWFVLFDGWALFGPIYILYLLLGLGASGILVDFFFVTAGGGGKKKGEMESPISAGSDLLARRMVGGKIGAMAQRKPPAPPPPMAG
ncbi:MAG: hypothetical protein ABH854_02395 [Candidatus Diapherotrites archaeon]|nr:hypothetical protein [Candidatus Micrarchaeota archaeon]